MRRSRHLNSSIRRRVAMAAVAAGVASAVAGPQPALAQVPESRDITEFACPSGEVPEDGFGDVAPTNVHEGAVDCVAWYDIAQGTTLITYDPAGLVRRDQMATFIAALIDYVAERTPADDGLPAAPPGNEFPCDVSPESTHYANIQRLGAAGIVMGTGSTAAGECFDPGGSVTRGQMATFIANAQTELDQAVPASTANFFVDDDASLHEANIDAITAERITEGTGANAAGGDLYSPDAEVRRDQMASFLARKLDRLIDTTAAEPPATAEVAVTPLTVAPGAELTVSITGTRGLVDKATVNGCGVATPPTADPEGNPTPTLEFMVMVPPDQGGRSCTLVVRTTLEDASTGESRDQRDSFIITVS